MKRRNEADCGWIRQDLAGFGDGVACYLDSSADKRDSMPFNFALSWEFSDFSPDARIVGKDKYL